MELEQLQPSSNILVVGASSGIGRATAQYLSKCGARLTLVARREEPLAGTLASLQGDDHCYRCFDMGRLDDISDFIKGLSAERGPFSGMVYCVGIAPMRPLKMLRPAALNEVIQVNFGAYVEAVRCITQRGCYQEPMSIVAVSSVAALRGSKSKIAYSASKAAMDAATRCMAKELAEKGIRINTVVPSWVSTEMVTAYSSEWGDGEHFTSSMSQQFLGPTRPEEVAAVIAFLLGTESTAMSGCAIPVDGGRLS